MPTPLDVPKRPEWRYETVRMVGVRVFPARGKTDLDRNTTKLRTTKNDHDNPTT